MGSPCFAALVKILKKHDKRSSLSLRSPFLVSVLQQPFYSTEVLSQLIGKVEGRFRKLSAMMGEVGETVAQDKVALEGGETVSGAAAGAAGAGGEAAAASEGEGGSDSELGHMARTRAAMECWVDMKDSDSILRPYGDVPRRKGTKGVSVTPSPRQEREVKRRAADAPGGSDSSDDAAAKRKKR